MSKEKETKKASKKKMIDCVDFGLKLNSLYDAVGRNNPTNSKPVKDAQLVEEIGVGKATISAWRKGVINKGRPPNRIGKDHLQKLSLLFVKEAPHITEGEAYDLWVKSPADPFRRRLLTKHMPSLLKTFANKPPTLPVVLYRKPDGPNFIEEEYPAEDGEIELPKGTEFFLDIGGKKGRSLIVLSYGPGGALWLSPSPFWHDGRVTTVPESIPHVPKFWKAETKGKSDVYCLELDAATPPYIRQTQGDLTMTSEMERGLLDELHDYQRSGEWRWNKISVRVV